MTMEMTMVELYDGPERPFFVTEMRPSDAGEDFEINASRVEIDGGAVAFYRDGEFRRAFGPGFWAEVYS